MATSPPPPRVVVIGAGIVGNSLVHHLARARLARHRADRQGAAAQPGRLDRARLQLHLPGGPLPRDHRPDPRLGAAVPGDGRLHRSPAASRSPAPRSGWRSCGAGCRAPRPGASRPSWSSPAFVKEKVPVHRDRPVHRRLLDAERGRRRLAAGGHDHARERPRDRRADRRTERRGHRPRHRGGADGRRIRRVRTTGGDIEAEYVVIACGVWSPKIGDMAGISIPLTPAVHQMISVGPCPQLAEREGEISFPIVRDMDTFCYERQHGADMEVGSYAHRAILHEPEEIPSIEQAKLSPTEMPFTSDDFDPQLEQAYELMPELLGAEGAEMRYAINGLLSLTCDGNPILGESQVKGPVDRGRGLDQGGPGRRPRGRRVDDPRPLRDRHPPQRHRPLPPAPDAPRAHPAAHHRGVHQDLRDHPPRPSSTSPTATSGWPRCTSRRRSSARSSSRPPAGSGRTGTSRTPACSRSTATP